MKVKILIYDDQFSDCRIYGRTCFCSWYWAYFSKSFITASAFQSSTLHPFWEVRYLWPFSVLGSTSSVRLLESMAYFSRICPPSYWIGTKWIGNAADCSGWYCTLSSILHWNSSSLTSMYEQNAILMSRCFKLKIIFVHFFIPELPCWSFRRCHHRVLGIDFGVEKFRKASVGEKTANHLPWHPCSAVRRHHHNQPDCNWPVSTNGMEFQLHQHVWRFHCWFSCGKWERFSGS